MALVQAQCVVFDRHQGLASHSVPQRILVRQRMTQMATAPLLNFVLDDQDIALFEYTIQMTPTAAAGSAAQSFSLLLPHFEMVCVQ